MKSKNTIKESISESAISPLSYIVFIDASVSTDRGRGYLKMMFPNENPDTIRSWHKSLINASNYKSEKENLQAISSRFSNNPSLKTLVISLQKILSVSYPENEKDRHESDIQSMIQKISGFIKRRLTDKDAKLLETFVSELNSASEKISIKMDEDVAKLAVSETEPEKKDESKINERLKNKFRKKIKEIIRTHLFNTK
jgi:hypothetical protein